MRWAGAVARQLRHHDVSIGGKTSGYAATDALTLADLSIQELLVAALRDMGPRVRACRMEAEETSGDLGRFASDGEWVLALDPIDGTREYRDRTGNGYSVMVHLRSATDVAYSLVYLPEDGPNGSWVETGADGVAIGADDHGRVARAVLESLPRLRSRPARNRRILVEGFLRHERERAAAVTAAGLHGVLDPSSAGVCSRSCRVVSSPERSAIRRTCTTSRWRSRSRARSAVTRCGRTTVVASTSARSGATSGRTCFDFQESSPARSIPKCWRPSRPSRVAGAATATAPSAP